MSDHCAFGFRHGREYGLGIQRCDGAQINNLYGDALRLQLVRGSEDVSYRLSVADDRYIRASSHDIGLTQRYHETRAWRRSHRPIVGDMLHKNAGIVVEYTSVQQTLGIGWRRRGDHF